MANVNFYTIPDREKAVIFQQTSSKSLIPAYAVEKDWWVVQCLSAIFSMDLSKHLVFKGGTSLSKGWGLIERFSEDIDLAIDRRFFGFEGHIGRSQIDKLRRTAGAYIDDVFLPQLQKTLSNRGFGMLNIEIEAGERSDRDRSILLHYPYIIESPGYLQPRVKLEFSCRSLMEPSTMQKFGSLVDQSFPNTDFAESPITVPTVNPERTFLEKLFLLHEEFQRPLEKIRSGERLSRHLYDVVKLSKTAFADTAFSSPELYQTIVVHRQQFNPIPGIDYTKHQPRSINPIPADSVLAAWKSDYNTMREEMIYEENAPSFEQLVSELRELQQRVNALPWTFDTSLFDAQ